MLAPAPPRADLETRRVQDEATQTPLAIEGEPGTALPPRHAAEQDALWVQMAMVAMVLGGLVLVMFGLKKWQATRATAPTATPASGPKAARPSRVPQATPNATNEAAELRAVAKEIGIELDAAAARLESLVAQARDEGDRLERLIRQSSELKQRNDHAPARLRETSPDTPSEHRDVYTLADRGLSPIEIATKLNRPTGQVELILNLRRAATGR